MHLWSGTCLTVKNRKSSIWGGGGFKICGGVVARTCSWVNGPLDQVVVLVDPLAVALEVDLRGRAGAAGQRHRLVLHDELVLRLHQEVRQQVRKGGGKCCCGVLRPFRELKKKGEGGRILKGCQKRKYFHVFKLSQKAEDAKYLMRTLCPW